MNNKRPFQTGKPSSAQPAAPTTPLKPTAVEFGPSRDEVARTAYFLYLSRGCPQGQDVQHWLEAEARTVGPQKPGRGTVLM